METPGTPFFRMSRNLSSARSRPSPPGYRRRSGPGKQTKKRQGHRAGTIGVLLVENTWSLHDPSKMGASPKIMASWTPFLKGHGDSRYMDFPGK